MGACVGSRGEPADAATFKYARLGARPPAWHPAPTLRPGGQAGTIHCAPRTPPHPTLLAHIGSPS
eukprot:352952-Chlamydomonas_euryale.AAC.1